MQIFNKTLPIYKYIILGPLYDKKKLKNLKELRKILNFK